MRKQHDRRLQFNLTSSFFKLTRGVENYREYVILWFNQNHTMIAYKMEYVIEYRNLEAHIHESQNVL